MFGGFAKFEYLVDENTYQFLTGQANPFMQKTNRSELLKPIKPIEPSSSSSSDSQNQNSKSPAPCQFDLNDNSLLLQANPTKKISFQCLRDEKIFNKHIMKIYHKELKFDNDVDSDEEMVKKDVQKMVGELKRAIQRGRKKNCQFMQCICFGLLFKMNFTIQENKHPKPQNKEIVYSYVCDVNVQRIMYNVKPIIEDRIQDYFANESLETHRHNELQRLFKTAVLQGQSQQLVESLCSLYLKHQPPPSKLYILLKSLILCCNLTTPHILSPLQPHLQLSFFSILLLTSIFTPYNTLLLNHLQSAFFIIKSPNLLQQILKRQPPQVNLEAGFQSMKRLKIKTQEFRRFVVELWEKIIKNREKEVVGKLDNYLGEVVKGEGRMTTGVEYLFVVVDSLWGVYSKTIKGTLDRFMAAGEYGNIVEMREKLTVDLSQKGYLQLLNSFEICLKEWLNANNNYLQLAARTFLNDKLRTNVISTFLPLIQNFKETQKLYIRLFIKNQTIDLTPCLPQFCSILGANYSSHLSQLSKDFSLNTKRLNSVVPLTVTVFNKTLYPKDWTQNPLEQILKNQKLIKAIQKSDQKIVKLFKQLAQIEQEWNRKQKLRSCKFVHHRIISTDGNILSLEQFIVLLQRKSPQIPSIDPSIKLSDFQSTPPPTYETYYPTLVQKQQIKQKQPQEVPHYVVEAKIIKYLKKNKSSTAEQINSSVGFKEELIRILLEQLIKKDYVKKEGELFVYVP